MAEWHGGMAEWQNSKNSVNSGNCGNFSLLCAQKCGRLLHGSVDCVGRRMRTWLIVTAIFVEYRALFAITSWLGRLNPNLVGGGLVGRLIQLMRKTGKRESSDEDVT